MGSLNFKFAPGEIILNKQDLTRMYKVKSITLAEDQAKYTLSNFYSNDQIKELEYVESNYIRYIDFLADNYPGKGWKVE